MLQAATAAQLATPEGESDLTDAQLLWLERQGLPLTPGRTALTLSALRARKPVTVPDLVAATPHPLRDRTKKQRAYSSGAVRTALRELARQGFLAVVRISPPGRRRVVTFRIAAGPIIRGLLHYGGL